MYQRVIVTPSIGIASANVFTVGAAGLQGQGPKVRPFVVIRTMLNVPSLLPSFPVIDEPYQIWVHDAPGSMTKVDSALEALKAWLPTQAPAEFGGKEIFACEWSGHSDDLYDDHYKTNTRHADFVLKVK